jgi:phosphoglucosamine mutase
MLKKRKLRKNTVVATVMSNMGLDIAIRKAGGKIVKTAVGDRYVVEEMIRGGYNFGGEQSGHLIFLDYNTTGDGIQSALQVLAIMRRREKPLSELAQVMTPLPQVLVNVKVREKQDIRCIPAVASMIDGIEAAMKDEGRVLIRYSGTEPLLRIMLEGQNQEEINGWADELAALVRTRIGGE